MDDFNVNVGNNKNKEKMKMRKVNVTNIVFYDKDNKFLMQLRDKTVKVYPNYWGLFGGKIDEGENEIQALEREIQEELGYKLENYEFLFCDKYLLEGISYGNWFTYMKKISDKEKMKMKLFEGSDWGWFSYDERKKLLINDDLSEMLDRAYEIIFNKK